MMLLKEWNSLYRHNFDWVLRRLEPDCLETYRDTEQEWIEAIRAFNKIQEELFKFYGVTYKSGNKYKRGCIKGLELTANQLFELFHKHLSKYESYTVRYFIFHWWNDLRYYVDGALPPLDQPYLYYKPATREEIEFARKYFSHVEEELWYGEVSKHDHTFSDDASVLEYRGERFIVDNEWRDAWTLNKDGKVVNFQLVWDWWYPIDEYLDLYNI